MTYTPKLLWRPEIPCEMQQDLVRKCQCLNGYTTCLHCKLHQLGIKRVFNMVLKSQLHWAGHVYRMGEHRLPKIALYSKLSTSYYVRGAPKKNYKDLLKKSLGTCHIGHHQKSTLTADCQTRYCAILQAVSTFEVFHREKRHRKKDQEVSAAIPGQTRPDQTCNCSHYSQPCLSCISLVSHYNACSRHGQTPLHKFSLARPSQKRSFCL